MYLEKIVKEGNPPRAKGTLRLSIKGDSKIQELFQQGATKVLFPRHKNRLECVMINTSGGLTGGDEFLNSITCKDKSLLTLLPTSYYKNEGEGQCCLPVLGLRNCTTQCNKCRNSSS